MLQPTHHLNKQGGKRGAFNPVLQRRSEMKAVARGHSINLGQSSDPSVYLPHPHLSTANLGQVCVCSSSPFVLSIASKHFRARSSTPCQLLPLEASISSAPRSRAGGHELCASRGRFHQLFPTTGGVSLHLSQILQCSFGVGGKAESLSPQFKEVPEVGGRQPRSFC